MTSMTRLVQLKRGEVRRVALVEEPYLRLLDGCGSIYELANMAISNGVRLSDLAQQRATGDRLDYDPIYRGQSNGIFCLRWTIRTSRHGAQFQEQGSLIWAAPAIARVCTPRPKRS